MSTPANIPTLEPMTESLDAVFRNPGSRKLALWRQHNHDDEFGPEHERAFRVASPVNAGFIASMVKKIGDKLDAQL